MTTAAWPTPKSTMTRKAPPLPGCCGGQQRSSPPRAFLRIERVLSDNAFACRNPVASKQAVADIGAEQRFIKPHCPWTNGKVERAPAPEPWLNHYNNERIHTGIGTTPINRVSPT